MQNLGHDSLLGLVFEQEVFADRFHVFRADFVQILAGEKQGGISDADGRFWRDDGVSDFFAVDVSAIEAFGVLNCVFVRLELQDGVFAGDFGVMQDDGVALVPSNGGRPEWDIPLIPQIRSCDANELGHDSCDSGFG